MAYLTPAQLISGGGSLTEIAQIYAVDESLLRATVDGDDRSEWSAEQIAAADAALVSIIDVLERASAEIDTYLARRGYALPLQAAQFPALATWARMIGRYHIQQQRDVRTEDSGRIERDYRSASRDLEAVAAGRRGLGAGDPLLAAESAGSGISMQSEGRLFSRDSLRGL